MERYGGEMCFANHNFPGYMYAVVGSTLPKSGHLVSFSRADQRWVGAGVRRRALAAAAAANGKAVKRTLCQRGAVWAVLG